MMPGRRSMAVTGATVLIGALIWPGIAYGSFAAPTCLGKRATIVGTTGPDELRGTRRADVIVAAGGNDTVLGRGGNDRICSGAGIDVIDGGGGADRVVASKGLDFVLGGGGNDSIDLGGGFLNFAEGGPGSDVIKGAGPFDVAAYDRAPNPVTANLAAGTATGHGSDTLTGIEGIIGSGFDDSLTGDTKSNLFVGLGGNDTLDSGGNPGTLDVSEGTADLLLGDGDAAVTPGDDTIIGGSGLNIVSFETSTVGVTVDLLLGTAAGEGSDTLTGIQAIIGSPFNDDLTGDIGSNAFEGRGGNDTVDGSAGRDAAWFLLASQVTADLSTGNASTLHQQEAGQVAGSVTMTGIEDIWGSPGPDILTGAIDANQLYGFAGGDTIAGAAGDDLLDGGPGSDDLDGGDGSDDCVNGETTVNCETQAASGLWRSGPMRLGTVVARWRSYVRR